jgi:hypothetical protein
MAKNTLGLAIAITLSFVILQSEQAARISALNSQSPKTIQASLPAKPKHTLSAGQKRLLTQAEKSTAQVSNPRKKADILIRLAKTHISYGQTSSATKLLSQAFSIAQTISDANEKGQLAARITAAQLQTGQRNAADKSLQIVLKAAQAIAGDDAKREVLYDAIGAYAQVGDLNQANKLVELLPNPLTRVFLKTYAVEQYLPYLITQQKYEEAIALIQTTRFSRYDESGAMIDETVPSLPPPSADELLQGRVRELPDLIRPFTSIEDRPAIPPAALTQVIVKTAQQWIDQISDPQKKLATRYMFTYDLQVYGLQVEALESLNQLTEMVKASTLPTAQRIKVLSELMIYFVRRDPTNPTVQKSLQVIQSLLASYGKTDTERQDKVARLVSLASLFAPKQPDQALTLIQQARDVVQTLPERDRAMPLIQIAKILNKANHKSEALVLAQQVSPSAQTNTLSVQHVSSTVRSSTSYEFIELLIGLGQDAKAEKLVRASQDGETLRLLISHFVKQKKFDAAISLTSTIPDPIQRVAAWSEVASGQAAANQQVQSRETMQQILTYSRSLSNDQSKIAIGLAFSTYGNNKLNVGDFISLVDSLKDYKDPYLPTQIIATQLSIYKNYQSPQTEPLQARLQTLIPQLSLDQQNEQWSRLATIYEQSEQPEKALEAIARIQSPTSQVQAVLSLFDARLRGSEPHD